MKHDIKVLIKTLELFINEAPSEYPDKFDEQFIAGSIELAIIIKAHLNEILHNEEKKRRRPFRSL